MDEDAVDRRIVIQLGDVLEEFGLADRLGEVLELAADVCLRPSV